MKNKKTIWVYMFLPVLLVYNIVAAQILVEREPHHKIIFENGFVRLIDLRIMAADTTLTHIHAAASVVVFLFKSIFGIQAVGETPIVTQVNAGDMIYSAYDEKPVTHTVWNQGISMFRCMVVEMKKQHGGNATCSILSEPGIKFQWQQKLVSAYNLDISKGSQYNLPKSNCGYILIDISGIVTVVSSGSMHSMEAGGFIFFPRQSNIKIGGNNNEIAAFTLLELK
ncbi:MAG: hypothetical protein ABI168_11770 [Ginsengibacter sp.]